MDIIMLVTLIKMFDKDIKIYLHHRKLLSVLRTEPVLKGKFVLNILLFINIDIR